MARTFKPYATLRTRKSGTSRPGENLFHEPLLWRCILLAALTYLVWSEKISIVLNLSPRASAERAEVGPPKKVRAAVLADTPAEAAAPKPARPKAQVVLPPSSKGHITYAVDPGFAERNGTDNVVVAQSMQLCREYVERYAPVAVAEMQQYGIPASITLAQGLLESNAGDSQLAQRTNNHFGIKCFSNKCKKGHCANFTDDSHKDFFVRYDNVWSSYRAHSAFLKNTRRYSPLFQLGPTDYAGWARGLAEAGYATDKKYADKLIALIENLELERFGQGVK